MEIPRPNVTLRPEPDGRTAERRFETQLEHRLHELKADIADRPFLYSGMAFIAGFVSNTYLVRVLFVIVTRVLSWLVAPVILVIGVIKLSDLFSND